MENKNTLNHNTVLPNIIDINIFDDNIEEIQMGCGIRHTKQTTLKMQSEQSDELAV